MDETKRWFQWIAGENKGQVQKFNNIVQEDNEIYIVFKDGSRINEQLVAEINAKDLTGKFMAEVENLDNIWNFKEEWVGREEEKWEQNANGEEVCVIPFSPGRKIIKIIPPRPSYKRSASFGTPENLSAPPPPIDKIDRTNPVFILISKSKKNDHDINIDITISLPPQNLFKLIKESFDSGDEKFIEYIVEEIDIQILKDSLVSGQIGRAHV